MSVSLRLFIISKLKVAFPKELVFFVRMDADKSLAFPICSTTKIIFLGCVKE
jgi:hypothetical protein